MPSLTLRGRHYSTGRPLELWMEGETIAAVREIGSSEDLAYVAPAFFDLQINGCLGRGFSSSTLTADDVRMIVTECRRHGISGLCPTLITNSFEALRHGLTTLRRCVEEDRDVARALPAIHLEGPYISAEDGPRGAHPKEHVRPPSWEEFQRLQEASGGRIRLVTLAPEHDGALEFIERLVQSAVVVAIGHTAASGARIRDAICAGARLSTHLGNGAHAVLPRHDNYLWEQLAADELWASIICDGHHLPPSVIKCICRVKTPARLILTCDASSLAGLPPGRYREWGQELEIRAEGKIVVAGTPYLAGSWAFTDHCVGYLARLGELAVADVIAMAAERPRQLLGLPIPRLEAGQPADLVLFEKPMPNEVRWAGAVIAGHMQQMHDGESGR